MTPDAFSVHRVALAADQLTYWPLSDPLVEKLWLPLIGPTPFVLLRHINSVLGDQAEWGEPARFRVDDVGEHLGVHRKRAFESLLRLGRFHLIDDDQIDTTYDHPVMIWRGAVRPIGVKEWRRLPASVREHYASMPL